MANISSINVSDVRKNPKNPRIIRDAAFKKLVQSIRDFPEMLEIRPIVLNNKEEKMILGGSQRFKACLEAGMKKIPVIYADFLDEKQQREFTIKDNASAGEWDWNELLSSWHDEADMFNNWGIEMPSGWGKNEMSGDAAENEESGDEQRQRDASGWYVNVKMDSELDCQKLYENLINQGYDAKIIR